MDRPPDQLLIDEEKCRSFLRYASDGVHILDECSRLVEASQQFFNMLGYAANELLGRHVSVWDTETAAPEELTAQVRHYLAVRQPAYLETRHRHKDGR